MCVICLFIISAANSIIMLCMYVCPNLFSISNSELLMDMIVLIVHLNPFISHNFILVPVYMR